MSPSRPRERPRHRLARWGAALVVLAAAACSGSGSRSSGSGSGSSATSGRPDATTAGGTGQSPNAVPSSTAATRVVKIGYVGPISDSGRRGRSAVNIEGRGIRAALRLAVRHANDDRRLPDVELELVEADDGGRASTARNAVRRLAGDRAVVGIVVTGPRATDALDVARRRRLLTVVVGAVEVPDGAGDSGTLIDLGTTAGAAGRGGAQYLYGTIGARAAILVAGPNSASAAGPLAAFRSRFEALGGSAVVSRADSASVAEAVRATSGPVAVLVADGPPATSVLDDLRARQLNTVVMGVGSSCVASAVEPAGGADSTTSSIATTIATVVTSTSSAPDRLGGVAPADGGAGGGAGTRSGAGALCAIPGAAPALTRQGVALVEDYAALEVPEPLSPAGAQAYDAVELVVRALVASPSRAGTPPGTAAENRASVLERVRAISFEGTSGLITFDGSGGRRALPVTITKRIGDRWTETALEAVVRAEGP